MSSPSRDGRRCSRFCWAWRTRASDEPPVVYLVDPVRDETWRVRVPGFPRAFGEPGVIYVAEEHPDTEEHVLVRYELSREER